MPEPEEKEGWGEEQQKTRGMETEQEEVGMVQAMLSGPKSVEKAKEFVEAVEVAVVAEVALTVYADPMS